MAGSKGLSRGLAANLEDMQELARRNLWMHFSPMGSYRGNEIPIVVRGDGCYVWDAHGNRYLDGLSSLFCVNAGHGRVELAEAAVAQARELDYFSIWSFAHPRAIELASRIAALAPGDLDRVFFTSGGSEAVEAALKLVRQYHKINGNPNKVKVVARETAYHGTTFGALSVTGVPALRTAFEPLTPGALHVPNTNLYHLPPGVDPLSLVEAVRERILFEDPETVAAVIVEPVQNAGGCLVAPPGYFERLREICDEFDVLLISDEVICSWGRLGDWFGCRHFGYRPDVITTAKGITSAYAPMGAMIVSDRIGRAFDEEGHSFAHGHTFAGHPMAAAVSLANIELFEREHLLDHVRENEDGFSRMLESLRDVPIVGDVRGAGYFYAIELTKNPETKERFTRTESDTLVKGFLAKDLYERGLICRADNRGDPVVQLAPPLIAGTEQWEEIEAALRPALSKASQLMGLAA